MGGIGFLIVILLTCFGLYAYTIVSEVQRDLARRVGTDPPVSVAPAARQIADADLIPGNAQGFAILRPADLLYTGLARKALAEAQKAGPPGGDPLKQAEEETGVNFADVESVAVVVADFDKKVGWGLATGTRPWDRDKLRAKWFKGQEPEKVAQGGWTLEVVVTPDGERKAVCFLTDTLLAAGPEEGVKRCVGLIGSRPAGPLDGTLQFAGEKHLLLVGGTPPPDLMTQARVGLPPEWESLKPVLDAKGMSLTLDLGDQLTLDATLHMPDKAKGEEAKMAVDSFVSKLRFLLPSLKGQLAREMPPAAAEAVFKQLQAALGNLKVEQAGYGHSAVRVQVSVDARPLSEVLLSLVPAMMAGGRGPGPAPPTPR
jgi:hypothetical protein